MRSQLGGAAPVDPYRGDFRAPDGGWLTPDAVLELHVPTAVAVLEVLSPQDETWAKLDFYAARGVQEVLVADAATRAVSCRTRAVGVGAWREVAGSELFGISMSWLAQQIRWS